MPTINQWKALALGPRLDNPPATTSTTSRLTQGGSSQHTRVPTSRDIRKAYSRRQPVTSTSTGVYTFNTNVQSASTTIHDQQGPGSSSIGASSTRASSPELSQTRSSSPTGENDSTTQGWSSDYPDPSRPASPSMSSTPRISISATQWTKWTKIVIPSLTHPYFALMRRTESLGCVDRSYSPICTCHRTNTRMLNVTCVFFDCMCYIL